MVGRCPNDVLSLRITTPRHSFSRSLTLLATHDFSGAHCRPSRGHDGFRVRKMPRHSVGKSRTAPRTGSDVGSVIRSTVNSIPAFRLPGVQLPRAGRRASTAVEATTERIEALSWTQAAARSSRIALAMATCQQRQRRQ